MSIQTFLDLPWPSMTFHDLLWPSMTFYHLLRPLWPSMIKCLLSRPGLIAGPLHSTPLPNNSQSIQRLDPIDSKSRYILFFKLFFRRLPFSNQRIIRKQRPRPVPRPLTALNRRELLVIRSQNSRSQSANLKSCQVQFEFLKTSKDFFIHLRYTSFVRP